MFNSILYFHEFNSSVNSKKYKFLKKHLEKSITAIPYPPYANEAYSRISTFFDENQIVTSQNVLLVGSSLGGFWANFFGVKYNLPVILINPALFPSKSLKRYIGQNINNVIWKKEFSDQYKNYESNDIKIIPRTFLLSEYDEILNHSQTIKIFSDISHIKLFNNTGHHFNKYDEILQEIYSSDANSISWGLDGE